MTANENTPAAAPIVSTDGVTYTPWTNGTAVGYVATDTENGKQYVYLNPSGGSDDGVPTVYVYQGKAGDPAVDSPATHLVVNLGSAVERIMEKLKAELDDRYELVYTSYDESLRPIQVNVLLKGENPWDSSEFSSVEDAEDVQKYAAAIDILKEALTEHEFALLEGDAEALDEARFVVMNRDTSDIVGSLLKTTGSMLVRYDLGVAVSTTWSSSEEERADMIAEIGEALHLEPGHPAYDVLPELLANSGYGGRLWALWYADVEELVKTARPYQAAIHMGDTPAATITFGAGFSLLCLDKLNGSGHDVKVDGPVTVPFDAANLTTDEGDTGYSWNEIAGVVARAYDADVTIQAVPTVEVENV